MPIKLQRPKHSHPDLEVSRSNENALDGKMDSSDHILIAFFFISRLAPDGDQRDGEGGCKLDGA
ncbi:hypothetical protein TSMEX_004959 [Taenia solium]|eukprot:TsM_000556100 transcript=TsM_000556100 gene=TsM_000556100